LEAGERSFPFVNLLVHREQLDENGFWNPVDGEDSIAGGLQVNVYGRRSHYLQLAEFFGQFAEIDTSKDGDFHQHFEAIFSADGRTRLHLILRKDDEGTSSFPDHFPR